MHEVSSSNGGLCTNKRLLARVCPLVEYDDAKSKEQSTSRIFRKLSAADEPSLESDKHSSEETFAAVVSVIVVAAVARRRGGGEVKLLRTPDWRNEIRGCRGSSFCDVPRQEDYRKVGLQQS